MGINVIQLNGQNTAIDYDKFEYQTIDCLEKTCSEANIGLLNNFPVTTSPDIRTDMVVTFCIKKIQGNYYRRLKNNDWIYYYNFITPICIINNFSDSDIKIDENNYLLIDNVPYDYSNDVLSLKFGLRNYLINRCLYKKEDLNLFPAIFIRNSKFVYNRENIIIAPELDWNSLSDLILNTSDRHIISIRNWNTSTGFDKYLLDIEELNDKASEDCTFGFLTKRKIDRIAKTISSFNTPDTNKKEKLRHTDNLLFDTQVIEQLKIRESEGKGSKTEDSLIILEGKAGTGKTSELINLMIRQLQRGRNARFMTYNHLLVYDIAKTFKSFSNSRGNSSDEQEEIGNVNVMTLHLFFFRLSKSLGVLHLMTEARMEELKKMLISRVKLAKEELLNLITRDGEKIFLGDPYQNSKEAILNSRKLKQQEKEVAVDFVNYLKRNNLSITTDLENSTTKFVNYKRVSLESICVNNIFIIDYYGVLQNILRAIIDPSSFYDEFNIQTKYELLFTTMEYGKHYLNNEDLAKGLIPRDIYVQRVNRVKGGHKLGKSVVLIDEGQDCHRCEKDILFDVFEPQNIAVASGGKEQLIRHVELCNWTASEGKIIPHRKYSTGKKSYRIKKNLLSLCNFIAAKFSVSLELEPLNTEDVGELIIDIRKSQSEQDAADLFKKLLLKGTVNKCIPYESLLVLLNPSHQIASGADTFSSTVIINEYGNIEEQTVAPELQFQFSRALAEANEYWDGTNDEIRRQQIPSYGEVRMIYYHSCRGLEAWSVACFDLDKFFDKKRAEPDAEKYLTDTVFSLETRKSMYAATWALMAMTRAIDTMYIRISNQNSELGKAILEYARMNSKACKLLE
jgi:hypothetical protein